MLQFARNDRLGIGWGINKLLNQGRDLMTPYRHLKGLDFMALICIYLKKLLYPGLKKVQKVTMLYTLINTSGLIRG